MRRFQEVIIDDDIPLDAHTDDKSPVKVVVRVYYPELEEHSPPEVIGVFTGDGRKIPIARLEAAGHAICEMDRIYGEWAQEILELKEKNGG